MNDKAVCRTAPATPGLSIIHCYFIRIKFQKFQKNICVDVSMIFKILFEIQIYKAPLLYNFYFFRVYCSGILCQREGLEGIRNDNVCCIILNRCSITVKMNIVQRKRTRLRLDCPRNKFSCCIQ